MCYTEVKRYHNPSTGERRIVDRLHLCGRHRGQTPCSGHTRYDSNQWVLDPEAAPASPAASLMPDNYSSPGSPGYPPTPGSANIEVREPGRPGRSASVKESRNNRYSLGDQSYTINSSTRDRKKSEKRYRKKSVGQRHSMDDVVVLDVNEPSVMEAPMPPSALNYSSNINSAQRNSMPPPPPPAPLRPGTAGSQPSIIPDSPTTERRRRPRPIVTGGFQTDVPPVLPSYMPAGPPKPIIREVEPKSSVDGPDNEFKLRQDIRENQRQEANQRQIDSDRKLAEKLARKQKQEEGEELLAKLERDRFAERDRIRAEINARREKEEAGEELLAKLERDRFAERDRIRAEANARREKEERERMEREQGEDDRRRRREQRDREKDLQRELQREEQRQRERDEREDKRRRKEEKERKRKEQELLHKIEQMTLEEEQNRKSYEAEIHQRKKDEMERRAMELRQEEERRKREEERQEHELRQAQQRARQLEQELRDNPFGDHFDDIARRRAELKRMEDDVLRRQEQLLSHRTADYLEPRPNPPPTFLPPFQSTFQPPPFQPAYQPEERIEFPSPRTPTSARVSYQDPTRPPLPPRIDGQRFNERLNITYPPEQSRPRDVQIDQAPLVPAQPSMWRERGEAVLAASRAQAAARDLNAVITSGNGGQDGRGRYYRDANGNKRYYP